ncbi:baseplate assembly protein [Burkholderia sp. Nafp2/4-1b]|uniref:GPW/gp25 family protein n=1 Tax=Burkholderia sp. Nafp2/4-1b TaxID=2116686 RepID=UPI000EF8B1DF|nr:GPW/gp25 family protein [Burkholderia sp. Nafp2/4-1b]RKU01958.1 baseplate assembly protein [Burkholderia sp. Nafp2/4-1b]
MIGMNATTGRALSGVDHLAQSVGKILTTPLASCLQRRAFGSELPELIDAPAHGATRVRLYAAVATALMRWEPRLTVTRVQLVVPDAAQPGAQCVDVDGWTDARLNSGQEPVSLLVPVSQATSSHGGAA